MLSEKDILLWQEHYKDLLREADQERRARQARAGERPMRTHQRALGWLGSQLVTWGRYLERRYTFGTMMKGRVE